MNEFRRDPVSGRWVIIASDRATRPADFHCETPSRAGGFCPFCEGNEDKTPGEIAAYRAADTSPDSPGWTVRVVPNKFPALRIEGSLDKRGEGMYDVMTGVGAHEVIIESPGHAASLTELPEPQIRSAITMYRDRLLDLCKDQRMQYGMIFKNVGMASGATLEHTHSQLVVMPVIPRNVAVEMHHADAFYEYRGRCLFCDMITQEQSAETRIVEQNEHFVGFAPFASRFPFEMWIMPLAHSAHFEKLPQAQVASLSTLLKRCLAKLEKALELPPYNYIIHTAPFRHASEEPYHWHIEIIPRIIKVAGFEWGTGFYINPVPPEEAARYLRQTEV